MLYSEEMSVFEVEVCFLYVARRMDSVVISNLLVFLFIGELSPFILKNINDQGLLFPVILVFIVGDVIVCVFPFCGICCC